MNKAHVSARLDDDGSLEVKVTRGDDEKSVVIRGPFDFEVIEAACSVLHDSLAGISETALLLAAMRVVDADGQNTDA